MPITYEPKPILWPGEANLRDSLLDNYYKYSDANQNLGKLTPQEQAALSHLDQYLKSGPSEVMTAGRDEILKNLRGEYDPETSAYYKPVVSAIERRRDTGRDRLRRQSQLGGNLSSLARARLESDSDIAYEGEIANLLMGLQQRERDKMFQSIPYAASYGEYEEKRPLMKADAARTIGSIPRDLETRSLDMGSNMLMGYKPTYYNPMDFMDYRPDMIELQQSQLDKERKKSLGQLIGTGGGAALSIGAAPFTGGASLAYLPTAMSAGGQMGGYFGGM